VLLQCLIHSDARCTASSFPARISRVPQELRASAAEGMENGAGILFASLMATLA